MQFHCDYTICYVIILETIKVGIVIKNMKKIISKKIEISSMLAFVLFFAPVSFVLAEDFSSEDPSPSSFGGKIEYKKIPEREERFDSAKRVLDQKNREEMERNSLKIKEIKNRLDSRLRESEMRFGSSTARTGDPTSSTTHFESRLDGRWVGFGTSTSSTAPFRKMELERMKKESIKIAERFADNLKRLEDFYKRISEKVGKFENKAVSADETKSLLGIARSKINFAKSDADNLIRVIKEGVGSQNINDYLIQVRNLSIKTKNSIHEAQKALSNAVNSLKPGLNKNKGSYFSSPVSSPVSSSTAPKATSSSGLVM